MASTSQQNFVDRAKRGKILDIVADFAPKEIQDTSAEKRLAFWGR